MAVISPVVVIAAATYAIVMPNTTTVAARQVPLLPAPVVVISAVTYATVMPNTTTVSARQVPLNITVNVAPTAVGAGPPKQYAYPG